MDEDEMNMLITVGLIFQQFEHVNARHLPATDVPHTFGGPYDCAFFLSDRVMHMKGAVHVDQKMQ
jgi:hypothetical protein